MGGKWYWIIGGLVLAFVAVGNAGFLLTAGAYDSRGYYLLHFEDGQERERVPVWIAGLPQPDEPHAVAQMSSAWHGLKGRYVMPDGSTVRCRLMARWALCDQPWVLVPRSDYERAAS